MLQHLLILPVLCKLSIGAPGQPPWCLAAERCGCELGFGFFSWTGLFATGVTVETFSNGLDKVCSRFRAEQVEVQPLVPDLASYTTNAADRLKMRKGGMCGRAIVNFEG